MTGRVHVSLIGSLKVLFNLKSHVLSAGKCPTISLAGEIVE